MNPIERTILAQAEVWKAGFRAGVEAAAKECERQKWRGTTVQLGNIHAALDAIRSLLNESGAAEKDEA